MSKRQRIAFYGGTFDPVHRAHLEIARRVSEIFELDQFVFVPARRAPHKIARDVSSAFHRYAMLALATRDESHAWVSTFELERPERQYTVDTVAHYRERLGQTADLFFVMGADSWADIATWHEWEQLLTLATVIVVTRPGFDVSSPPPSHIDVIDMREKTSATRLNDEGAKRVYITDAVNVDVSATAIREAARQGDDEQLTKLVTSEVGNYIRKYGLYRNTNEA